jgi:RNA polymerase sigma-70 factor (ECF subfamily)
MPPNMTARATSTVDLGELQAALADDAAFEAWYRRALPRVFSYLMSRCGGDRDLAEELTQQTFVAALEQRWRFEGRSDSVTWLCGIGRHKLADHFRARERASRRQLQMEIRQIELAQGSPLPPTVEDRELIADAFRSLPPIQRAMLAFVAQDGLSVAEAGRLLGKSPAASNSLLHRAREGFRRAYRGELPHD